MSASSPSEIGAQLLETFINFQGIGGMYKVQKMNLRLVSKRIKAAVDQKITEVCVVDEAGLRGVAKCNMESLTTFYYRTKPVKDPTPAAFTNILNTICRQSPLLREVEIYAWKNLVKTPECLSDLSQLSSLVLYGNKLSLADSFTKLTALGDLSVAGNHEILDRITPIQHLTDLETLSIYIFASPNVQASREGATLVLPDFLFNLPLESFHFYMNSLALPTDLDRLTRLKTLVLELPKIVVLQDSLFNLLSLESLSFSWCKEVRDISEDLGKLTNLTSLVFKETRLLQKIPASIGNLKKLEKLEVKGCHRIYDLPPRVTELTNLEVLALEDLRRWTWRTLPAFIGSITSLKVLTVKKLPDGLQVPDTLLNLHNLVATEFAECPNIRMSPELAAFLTRGWLFFE